MNMVSLLEGIMTFLLGILPRLVVALAMPIFNNSGCSFSKVKGAKREVS
jgi:hypothetical protein